MQRRLGLIARENQPMPIVLLHLSHLFLGLPIVYNNGPAIKKINSRTTGP